MQEATDCLIDAEHGIWIKEGLPPLVSGVALRSPDKPHTFVTDELIILKPDGTENKRFYGVRVVLGHGIYSGQHLLFIGSGGKSVREVVLAYNKTHPDDPIQFVASCSGTQTSVELPEGIAATTEFLPEDRVAISSFSDLEISLGRSDTGTVRMTVKPRNPHGGFTGLDQIRDVGSRVMVD